MVRKVWVRRGNGDIDMETPERKLVDSRELAKYFGVTTETVRRWVRNGSVPCIRPTRETVRFIIAEVERSAWIKARSDKD